MPTLTSGIDATWVNDAGVSYDAGELRRADAAIFASGGIARGLDVSVTASDEVRVESGSWVIDGEATAEGAGVYRGGIGAQASEFLEPRDATYGRVDLVVARQYDPDVVGTHATYEGAVEVLTGTPSASPSAPALPDLAIELARLDVPVNGGGSVAVDSSGRSRAATRSAPVFLHASYAGAVIPVTAGSASVVPVVESFSSGAVSVSGAGAVSVPAGVYRVSASVGVDSGDREHRCWVQVVSGGSVKLEFVLPPAASSEARATAPVSGLVSVASGDVVEMRLGTPPDTGAGTNIQGLARQTFLSLDRIGD